MPNHMMIDLETLGTGDRPVILQVGLVVFDPFGTETASPMQWTLSVEDSIRLGGRVEGSTFNWWMRQSEEARRAVTEVDSNLNEAILGLDKAYRDHRCERVWCHGATFDVPILDGYRRRAVLGDSPWRFHHVRDTRTLFELADQLTMWERPQVEVAHTAVADARQQARDVQSAMRALKNAISS